MTSRNENSPPPPEPRDIAPWTPEDTFWQENHQAIDDLLGTIAQHHPEAKPPRLDEKEIKAPSPKTMRWMWTRLMGRQHGTMEGEDSKIAIPRSAEYSYWPDMSRIHYGDHSFVIPSPIDSKKEYTKGFIIGGVQDENIDRLMSLLGYDPNNQNVRQIVVLSGQRPRGKWAAPGEATTDELMAVTAQYSGVDINKLKAVSPFVKTELGKEDAGLWKRPFATEYEMNRLAVEAVFYNQIDWRDYPAEITYDRLAQPKPYSTERGDKTIPARTEALVTYTLKDGRTVYAINGEAISRGTNEPRPTSDSITREAVSHLDFSPAEKIVVASSVPHTRAALDALTRVVNLRRLSVQSADMTTGKWLPWKELIAGMGEIPAMHKADLRWRAALSGQDPDSRELAKI